MKLGQILLAGALTVGGVALGLPTGPSVVEGRMQSQDPIYKSGYWDGYNGRPMHFEIRWNEYERAMYRCGWLDGTADRPSGQEESE